MPCRHFTAVLLAVVGMAADNPPPAHVGRFDVQEIETTLKVGYAVTLADINGDKKPDIVVADAQRVLWYENPTWKRHTVIQGRTKPDNVCVAAADLDGDGQLDLVLGADWKPANTRSGGTLQWLKRGRTLAEEWSIHPIAEEPTVHRVRVADLDGDGKLSVIMSPLQGRGASAAGNFTDGKPVRTIAFRVPADPLKGPWTPTVLDESLHVVHNLWPVPRADGGHDVLTASYEGVSLVQRSAGKWQTRRLHEADQSNPKSSRGASEVKQGKANGSPFIATVEPWHGNQIVTYTADPAGDKWQRHVIDGELRWGHAVWCADLDGDGSDELVVGVRDDPNGKAGDKHTLRRGVRVYKTADGGKTWARQLVDPGGVAVEDLVCGDLDGDGRPEIVAAGRSTGNVRIYWHRGK